MECCNRQIGSQVFSFLSPLRYTCEVLERGFTVLQIMLQWWAHAALHHAVFEAGLVFCRQWVEMRTTGWLSNPRNLLHPSAVAAAANPASMMCTRRSLHNGKGPKQSKTKASSWKKRSRSIYHILELWLCVLACGVLVMGQGCGSRLRQCLKRRL